MTQGEEYYFQGVSFQDENLQAALNINGQNCWKNEILNILKSEQTVLHHISHVSQKLRIVPPFCYIYPQASTHCILSSSNESFYILGQSQGSFILHQVQRTRLLKP